MKHLQTALVVFCAVTWGTIAKGENTADTAVAAVKAAAVRQTSVSQCFKVHRLLKTDSTHYWADWTNTCPYTIDAVYVMVGFRDQSLHEMGNGVWPMYFVEPGVHRVTRFSAPVADFETVHVHAITTDSALALKGDPGPGVPAPVTAKDQQPAPVKADPNAVGDNSVGKVAPASQTPAVIAKAASRAPASSTKPAAKTLPKPQVAIAKRRRPSNQTKY